MVIWFYARESEPFSPLSFAQRGVGGSESALYYVSKGLAALGHEVVVLNHCGQEAGTYSGVTYLDVALHRTDWKARARRRPPDVLVLFRRMLDVLVDIPSRLRVFWAHDFQGVSSSYPKSPISRWLAIQWRRLTGPLFNTRVDFVFAVSQFLADQFVWLLRTPNSQLLVMPNGVDPSLFVGQGATERDRLRLVYTSVPERGLGQLLSEIFPMIRSAFPKSELHVFSYRPLEGYRDRAGPGVYLRGSLPKPELAKELGKSSLLVYPSNVEELGAIALLEAMAAGVPVVTSSLGVLPELVAEGSRGIAVPGQPGTREFARAFAQAVIELLGDGQRLERMRAEARRFALTERSWDVLTRMWQEVLSDILSGRSGGTEAVTPRRHMATLRRTT